MRLLAIALVLSLARHIGAQAVSTSALEGTVIDSVHRRPLVGTVVRAARLGVDSEVVYLDTTDRRGRFRFDPIEAGRYAMTFESALLDSLEFGGQAPRVTVLAGETTQITLAVPSGATLRAAACPGAVFAGRTGALLGFVVNADTDQPLAGAEVMVAWSELAIDTTTGRVVPDRRVSRVPVDSSGQYRLCGAPTGEWLVVQVQHGGRAGSVTRVAIVDAVGVTVHNLSFSTEGSRSLADTREASDSALAPLAGTATLLGTIRSEGGAPVGGAMVSVLNTAPQVRTDMLGQYVLTGLPSGTHVVEVKLLGYRIERRTVELRAGRTVTADVALGRAIMLDSIAVVASRLRYPDFESRRKFTMRGTFIDEAEVARRIRYASHVSDMVREAPGYFIAGQGATALVMHGNCELLVVVNHDALNRTINDVAPSDVGAIELYPNRESAPSKLRWEMDRQREGGRNVCGAVVIWTRR